MAKASKSDGKQRAAGEPKRLTAALEAAAAKMSETIRLPPGWSLNLRMTGEHENSWTFRTTKDGVAISVAERGDDSRAMVSVVVPANKAMAILSGRLDAAHAFALGGIQVQGDVAGLQHVLEKLGFLVCE